LATTRVYILAKELGVKSAAIVKKCQDEDLDVKNHMSTISAGLAATIREWFSEGENVTTVETAEKVDLEKVRVKKKPKRKAAKKQAKPDSEADSSVAEPQAEEGAEAQSEMITEQPVSGVAVAELVTPIEPEPVAELQIELEPEPEPIMPAGPKLEKPAPAKLAGPKVVRVEAHAGSSS